MQTSGAWAAVPLSVAELSSHLTQCRLGRGLPPYKWHLDLSNCLATLHQCYRQIDRTGRLDRQNNGPEQPLLVTVAQQVKEVADIAWNARHKALLAYTVRLFTLRGFTRRPNILTRVPIKRAYVCMTAAAATTTTRQRHAMVYETTGETCTEKTMQRERTRRTDKCVGLDATAKQSSAQISRA